MESALCEHCPRFVTRLYNAGPDDTGRSMVCGRCFLNIKRGADDVAPIFAAFYDISLIGRK
ncbi:MAG: hypothetical protein AABZ39_04320 [Spirochaetota bacterium]